MDLIKDLLPHIDAKIIWDIKKNFLKEFEFLIDKKIVDESPETIETLVTPENRCEIIEYRGDGRFGADTQYKKSFYVTWYYKTGFSITEETKHLSFVFYGIAYINKSTYQYNLEILDPKKNYLRKLKELKIEAFSAFKTDIMKDNPSSILDEKFFTYFSDTLRETKDYRVKEINNFFLWDDFSFCIHNIDNLISELILFKPYLWDFEKNKQWHHDKFIYTYFPSFYDTQYIFLSEQIFQGLYVFWDRIANLLEKYFTIKTNKRSIYFYDLVPNFPENHKNEFYDWISNFYENDFKNLNTKRIEVVHKIGMGTNYFASFLERNTEEDKIKELQFERDNLTTYFIEQYKLCVEGLNKVLDLIKSKTTNP